MNTAGTANTASTALGAATGTAPTVGPAGIALPPPPALRGDCLVSLAVVGLDWTPAQIAELDAIARQLAARYQFWEILLVAPISQEIPADLLTALGGIANMRLLRVEEDNFYRLRLAAASEAIGDLVILTSGEEMGRVDLPALAALVDETNEVVVVTRPAASWATRTFLSALGYLINYRIDAADTLTVGFPRGWLAVALTRPDAELLLRFERRVGGRFRRLPAPGGEVPRRPRSVGRRLRLLADLLGNAAPRLLRIIAAGSLAMTVFAGLYGLYALLIWLLKPNVAQGWLTTSLLQVLITGFLGITVAALAIGIVKILERIEGILRYTIVDEVNTVDFFSKVTDLNVETPYRDEEGAR